MELTTTQQNKVAVQTDNFLGGLDRDDLITPRLNLMQKMSKAVDAGEARPGDIVDSLTKKIVGGENKPIEFIPLSMSKVYYRFKLENGKKEFWRIEPAIEKLAFETKVTEDGKSFITQNDQAMVWIICAIIDSQLTPYTVTFRSTSYPAGRKLVTILHHQKVLSKKKPHEQVFSLSCVKQTNDKGSFHSFDIAPLRAPTKEESAQAAVWFESMNPVNEVPF